MKGEEEERKQERKEKKEEEKKLTGTDKRLCVRATTVGLDNWNPKKVITICLRKCV